MARFPLRSRRLTLACLAIAASLSVGAMAATAGTTRGAADPGVTANSILLGGTASLTGSASRYGAIARGADTYFKYVNARGGVNGRKIIYSPVDDASNPAQAPATIRKLVEEDGAFAIFESLGSSANLGVLSYLATQKVPRLYVGPGRTSRESADESRSVGIGFQPSHEAEGWVYGKYLARTAGRATIAVLFQSDDDGKDFLSGLKRGLQRSKAKVIAAESVDLNAADVASQVAKLKSSGADTMALFVTPTLAIQTVGLASKLGWKPRRVIVGTLAAEAMALQLASSTEANPLFDGAISIAFLKDPTDRTWARDASMKLYRQIMRRYAPGADADDPLHLYGMAAAWTAADVLRKAGKSLTRASLAKTLGRYEPGKNPFVLPGITINAAGDETAIEQMILRRWHNGAWKSFGGLWGYRVS